MQAAVFLLSSQLFLRVATCQTAESGMLSLQKSMAQASAPQAALILPDSRAVNAALAKHNISKDMEGPLREAVASTEVDAHNYPSVAHTLAAALAPWNGKDLVAAPQDPDTLEEAWPPVDEGGVPVPTAMLISGAKAAEAQPVPSQVDRSSLASSHCCALVDGINFRSNLPVVVVDTGGVVIPVRSNVKVRMCTCGAAFAARGGGSAEDFEGYMNVKVRGSSSAVQHVKKQLGIKLRWAKDKENSGEGRRRLNNNENSDDKVDGDQGAVQAAGPDTDLDEDNDGDRDADNSISRFNSQIPELGKKRKASLMGMPAGSHFVLWSGDGDTTLGMRNALAYDMARATDNWAPRVQFCELFVIQDGKPLSIDHYAGNTLLLERIKRDKHRVDVQKLKPEEDLSGGYIWGYERNLWDDLRFTPTLQRGDGRGLTYLIDYPKSKQAIHDQQQGRLAGTALQIVTWAGSYMASAEAALVLDQPPKTEADLPSTGTWRALVNETAMVDYLLVTEVTKNPDGFRGSIYMSKDRGKPLHIGPVWDYNEAFGMCCGYPIAGYQNQGISNGSSGGSAISPGGFRFNICDEPKRCMEDPIDGISLWFRATWNREPRFRSSVAQRWKQLRRTKLSDGWFKSRLRTYVQELAFAAPRSAIRWAAVLESPYYESPYHLYRWSVRSLGEWLFPRLSWLDAAFDRVLREVGSVTGATGDGQPGWEQAVMDAAVATADAEAQGATAFGTAGPDAGYEAGYGQDAQSQAISDRLAQLRRAVG